MNLKPVMRCRQRAENVYVDLMAQGVPSWIADVISKRVNSSVTAECCFQPTLAKIHSPVDLPDMGKAVDRIVQAIVSNEKVIFCVDHDMDGQAAAAVLWSAFVQHFNVSSERLSVITSHRLAEGYGISDAVAERIINSDATLIISADKGSSDEPRIKLIAATGKDVIVTDHHSLPVEGPPMSAFACINPSRNDSKYDPYVCGAGVAWLTMAMVRTKLLKIGHLAEIPSMAALVDYVAVATVADCVSLRPDHSYTNRAFVKRGLVLINSRTRPCWEVFCDNMSDSEVTSQTIGFQLAPAIAAAGRLDWAECGFRFLVAKDNVEANKHWSVLKQENEQRKTIEREIRTRAFEAAQGSENLSLVFFLEDGHSGVHGITASRLVERFGKPSAIFALKGSGLRDNSMTLQDSGRPRLASGSFRGIPGLHVRDALQRVADKHPQLLVGFGGHAGAAGATILLDDFERFAVAYEEAVFALLDNHDLKPEIWVDGDLDPSLMTLNTLDQLGQLEPWGRDFPSPIYYSEFRVLQVKQVGDGSHLKLSLQKDHCEIPAIWFNAIERGAGVPIEVGQTVAFAFELKSNTFRGKRSLQLQIISLILEMVDGLPKNDA